MEDLRQLCSDPTETLIYNNNNNNNNRNLSSSSSSAYNNPNPNPVPLNLPESEPQALKSKMISHPHFSTLLNAYVDCHAVGAPPDVSSHLSVLAHEFQLHRTSQLIHEPTAPDPDLDHFMEVYCDMLVKYREELTKPLKDAMDFFTRVQLDLNSLITNINGSMQINSTDDKCGACSSEEDQQGGEGATEISEIDSVQADQELKHHLLEKYGGCLSSLKQQLSKKKKKSKLPKDARRKLLSWWDLHCKWPYPSESEKVELAESTGLDQKQINNWFINQRKRHWKPSEDHVPFIIDGYHPQNSDGFCKDGRLV